MRVLQLRRGPIRRRQRDERGAVAVIVGLLMVVFLGIAAFTIDLGMSNISTRQLQTASDSAVLAAADVFKRTAGSSCSGVVSSGGTAAQAAARAIRESNRPGSVEVTYAVQCVNGSIEVTYTSQGTTSRFFGGFVGRTTDYTTQRSAKARVAAVSGGIGIKPYALCASQVPTTKGIVFKMSLPSAGNSICPGASSSGNWWTVDCPESAGSNSNAVLADKTLNGCTTPLHIVPNQTTTPARTASGLRTYLEGYCTPKSNDTAACLGANSGNINGAEVRAAWTTLASEQRRALFPVFCGGAPLGACDTAAVVNAGGNNAVYPVHAMLGAQICGYRFGNQEYPPTNQSLTGDCGGVNNPSNLSTNDSGNTSQMNYLLLRVVDVPMLGSSGSSGCSIGTSCDAARVTFLVG